MDKKTLIAGLVAGLVYFLITLLFSIVGMPYMQESFFRLHGILWYVLKLPFDLLIGILFAIVYGYIRNSIPGKYWNRGFTYGFFVFFLAEIPMLAFLSLTFTLPGILLLIWTVGSFIARLLMGFVLALFIK
ncbi:MAG: hypothetical protein KJ709_00380 [Nanoarchaeota archaeon]|nr:hypothetical protein [Nanoarchaeota archaeon]